MLKGDRVVLRAFTSADVPVLHAELETDVELMMRAAGNPWRPRSLERAQARFTARTEKEEPDQGEVGFAVDELSSGELAGEAYLWGIDTHNRFAHLGFSLRPSFRGRGLGSDLIRVLCDYGFRVRGLHRLQVETLADNTEAQRAATAAGFVPEGQLRGRSWVAGAFVDEVVLGLLAEEWFGRRDGAPGA